MHLKNVNRWPELELEIPPEKASIIEIADSKRGTEESTSSIRNNFNPTIKSDNVQDNSTDHVQNESAHILNSPIDLFKY